DDEVELFFDPTGTKGYYFHFMANAAGVKREEDRIDPSWTCDWKVAAGKAPGKWVAEMFIPFAAIDVQEVSLNPVWGINFCRNDQQTKQATQWTYTGGSFHRPERFGSYGPLNIDLARWECRMQLDLPDVFWPGANTVRVKCRSLVRKNDTAKTPGKAVLTLNVYDASRNLLSHETRALKASPGSKTIPIRYNLPGAGDYFLEATIRVGGGNKETYRTPFQKIRAIDEPVMNMKQPADGIVFPPERNTPLLLQVLLPPMVAGGSSRERQIRFQAVQESGRVWASLPDKPVQENVVNVEWPIGDWPAGRYRIEATVRAGQWRKTVGRDLFIVPNDTHNYVRLDEFGRTVVKQHGNEERLFFPIGLFAFDELNDETMRRVSESGVNGIHNYKFFPGPSNSLFVNRTNEFRKQYLDTALAHGMMVLLTVNKNIQPYKPEFSPDFTKMRAESIERTVAQTLNYRSHPAVLSWYAADEPEGWYCKPPKLEEFYRLLKKQDPLHPVSAAFYSMLAVRDYYDGYDVAMPDKYPYPERVAESYAMLHQFYFRDRRKLMKNPKPFWAILQSYDKKLIELKGEKGKDYPRGYPLYAEMRLMTFHALASGARGIWYYDWDHMQDHQAKTDLLRVTKELAALSPILLAEKQEFAKISDADDVCGIWLEHDGAWYLLLANGSVLKERQARVALPKTLSGQKDISIQKIVEGKKEHAYYKAVIKDGTLRIKMAPMEAVVLKIPISRG
ncbi:MAG: hypothetical protein JXA11_03400, partial [Phycisphaerae bacterium]|nr:hypothetical protein [Phycisphaerae bacterium]